MKRLLIIIALFFYVFKMAACTNNKETYTLLILDFDGSLIEERSVDTNDFEQLRFSIENPSLEGHTFIDWDVLINNESRVITANAKYEIQTFTVTWVSFDGSILEIDYNVPYNSFPSYDGEEPWKIDDIEHTYAFNGWSSELVAVKEDQLYTAQFIVDQNVYTIKLYDPFYQYSNYYINYVVEGTLFDPNDIGVWSNDDNYVFDKWVYSDGSEVQIPLTILQSTDIYVVWKLVEYDIRLHLNYNDGYGSNPIYQTIKTINYEIDIDHLPVNPSRLGYNFEGWHIDLECTIPIDSNNALLSSHITLYAKWEIKEYFTPGLSFYKIGNESYGVLAYRGTDEHVIIPNSYMELPVTHIKDNAFRELTHIKTVIIPNTVISIGYQAFYNCINLETITLPDSVKEINSSSFKGCDSLEYEIVNGNLLYLGNWLINFLNLEQDSNEFILKDTTIGIYQLSYLSTNNSYAIFPHYLVVPKSVKYINYEALRGFDVVYLEDDIPATFIENWDYYVDQVVTGFGRFEIVNHVRYALLKNGEALVEGLVDDIHDNVIIESEVESHLVTGITSNAFTHRYRNDVLKSIILPQTIRVIEKGAFYGCRALKKIIIPESVEVIGSYAIGFSSTKVFVEAEIAPIGWNKNWNGDNSTMWNFKSFIEDNDIRYAITKDDNAHVIELVNHLHNDIYIPNIIMDTYPVVSIFEYAFTGNLSFETIVISDSVKEIGYGSFAQGAFGNSKLTSITLPKYLNRIENSLFYYTRTIRDITLPETIESIGDYAFAWSGIENINIPNSVISMGEHVFQQCYRIKEIAIPSSLEKLTSTTFQYADSLYSIEVDEGNAYYSSIDGVLFNKDQTELIKYPAGKPISEYHIPSTVTKIGDDAFSISWGAKLNNPYLKHIYIPASVETIGFSAFHSMSYLESVHFDSDSFLTYIGAYAFSGCSGLVRLELPNRVRYIGRSAFEYCFNLTYINTPDDILIVGYDVFNGCSSLTYEIYDEKLIYFNDWLIGIVSKDIDNVVLKPTTKVILPGVFSNCNNITHITIPDSVTSIGDHAFYNCNINFIIIPDSVVYLGYHVFYRSRIYTEVDEKPVDWDEEWDYYILFVIWGGNWYYNEHGNPVENGL